MDLGLKQQRADKAFPPGADKALDCHKGHTRSNAGRALRRSSGFMTLRLAGSAHRIKAPLRIGSANLAKPVLGHICGAVKAVKGHAGFIFIILELYIYIYRIIFIFSMSSCQCH